MPRFRIGESLQVQQTCLRVTVQLPCVIPELSVVCTTVPAHDKHNAPEKGGINDNLCVCVCVCMCIFIKLHSVCVFIESHITAQSGPVILVILFHSR